MMQSTLTKTIFLSVVALIAFAGNSVLCRLALSDNAIDPAAFTIIRLVSGVFTLLPLLLLSQRKVVYEKSGSWLSAFMLFAYALLFSYAYVSIDTATGALILFGAVQITLVFVSFLKGNRLSLAELSGVALALSGFVYLVLPELQNDTISYCVASRDVEFVFFNTLWCGFSNCIWCDNLRAWLCYLVCGITKFNHNPSGCYPTVCSSYCRLWWLCVCK